MNVKDDLFGNVDLNEEVEVLEEVSPIANEGKGEDTSKAQASDNTRKEQNVKPDLQVSDLEQELIDVIDNPNAEDTSGDAVGKGNEEIQGKDTSSDKDANSSSSPEYKPIADFSKVLFDEGVLTHFDEKEFEEAVKETGDPIKALAQLVQKTIENVHEDWISNYPEAIQDLIKATQTGIPLDQMFSIKQNQFQLEGINEDKLEGEEALELRKNILAEHLRSTTNFNEAKIKKEVEKTINLGEDEEDAKEALKELKIIAKEKEKQLKVEAQKQQELQKQQYTERLESLKKDVFATKQIIPGIELTQKEQNELFNSMTKYVSTDNNGNPMTDADVAWAKHPVEMRKAFHYYFQKGLFKVDEKTGVINPDITKITNSLKTQVTKEMKDAANAGRNFKSGSPEARVQEMERNVKNNLGSSIEGFLNKRK